ncbi:MAG TPA: recombination mediator RecR [Planctomycetota bacterium]|nr:recombination mediator RecR [Planctomycetota bacterium]
MAENESSPLKDRSSSRRQPPAVGDTDPGASGARSGARVLKCLVEELEKLPGIGRRTAERLAYHVLRVPVEEAMRLAYAIRDVKKTLRHCRTCFHITEREECSICEDAGRDSSLICVVEEPKDVLAIEASGSYRGRYHVLLGAFAPLDGVVPSDLTIDPLLDRIRAGGVEEVIIATNPNFEGDGTALLLREKLRSFDSLRVTRIARGIPSGSHLEHVSRTIVSDAVEGRREMTE